MSFAPKKKRRKMEPLEFSHPPDGRRSPKIPNKKRDGRNANDCKPVKRKRLSSSDPTAWVRTDEFVIDPNAVEVARLARNDRRRNSRKDETLLSVLSDRRSCLRKTTRNRTRLGQLSVKVSEDEKGPNVRQPKQTKSIAVTSRGRPKKVLEDEAFEQNQLTSGHSPDNDADDVGSSSKTSNDDRQQSMDKDTAPLTSYFRVTRNAPATRLKSKKTPRMNAVRLLENFVWGSSSADSSDEEVERAKLKKKKRILAPDSPVEEYGLSNVQRRLLARRRESKTSKGSRKSGKTD